MKKKTCMVFLQIFLSTFFIICQKSVSKDKIEKGTKFAIIKGDNIMIHEIVNIDDQGLHIRSTFGSIYTDENPVSFTVEC